MDYKEIVTNIRAPVDDKGRITTISDNLHSKLLKENKPQANNGGEASKDHKFLAYYEGLTIHAGYTYNRKVEKKSDICLYLSYDYHTPIQEIKKYDVPTLDDLIVREGQSYFSSEFEFYKGSKAMLHVLKLYWDFACVGFTFKKSGDIEEIKVDYCGWHEGSLEEFNFITFFDFDYKSNNILTSFWSTHYSDEQNKKLWQDYIDGKVPSADIKDVNYCEEPEEKLWQDYNDGKVPSANIKDLTCINGTAFPFEVKYTDASIQQIESISTYIVDLDLNKHWVTFKI